ncbi:MAG: hypothetical protein H6719_38420, partial [Sandaracinaceae bacterium]|nr:hypothetical protein [Sandaracinaceae bacterium]
MRRRWLAAALLLAGCAPAPTQVFVHVDAEPGVRAMTRSIGIRIWGRARDGVYAEEPDEIEPVAGSQYVWRVSLHPLANDSTRFFRLEAGAYSTANGEGTQVAVARLQSGYAAGQTLHLYLLLQDSCIGRPCVDLDTTCAGAACIPIPEPVPFDPDAGLPRDAGTLPGDDGGMDAAVGDAGVDGATPLLDAGVDAARDAGVFGDGCVPAAEECNLMDDDCDERVDEDFDTDTDLAHCGGCGMPCEQPRATPRCAGGVCSIASCNAGFGDCDGVVPGCETPLTTILNCGMCGRACTGGLLCAMQPGGFNCVSSCTGGLTDCGGSCVDTDTDAMHCGGCDSACPARTNAVETCASGTCGFTCLPGFGDCDGLPGNGCERDLRTNVSTCGSCTRSCASRECQRASCMAGVCSYAPDDARPCDDGRPCTMNACMSGVCEIVSDTCGMDGGTPECMGDTDCPDMGPCSADQCLGGTCFHTALGPPCCTSATECDDLDACTIDSCDTSNMCQNTAIGGCTSCFGPGDCFDAEPCTQDLCLAGRCSNPVIPGCGMCGMIGCSAPSPTCCSDSGDYCCPSGAGCCMGSCCAGGDSCCGGTCCPSGSCCGSSCCGPGFSCCDGTTCCRDGFEMCMAGACVPIGGTDAGTGFDAG